MDNVGVVSVNAVETIQDALTIWDEVHDRIEFAKKRTGATVTSLYWMNIKMENNEHLFLGEIEKVCSLYSEFSELEDMYEEILNQLDKIISLIQRGIAEETSKDDNLEKLLEIAVIQQVCYKKMQVCVNREKALEAQVHELLAAVSSHKRKVTGFKYLSKELWRRIRGIRKRPN